MGNAVLFIDDYLTFGTEVNIATEGEDGGVSETPCSRPQNIMFQQLRRFLSIDRVADHARPSNRTTPSWKRHINSLPPELLIIIFQNCCGSLYLRRSDPVLLSLVCRFWQAIVTACPALWATIRFERNNDSAHRTIGNWSHLERRLTRAGPATISLEFHLSVKSYPHDEEERVLRLFSRCRELRITIENVDGYTFSSSITLPHLEHIALNVDNGVLIDPLLDSIARRSPLLRSLSISGLFPANLAQHRSLLRRIVCLSLLCIENNDISFEGFENLKELSTSSSQGESIKFVPLSLPKLVSLFIGNIALPINQQVMTFPLLERLELYKKWSNLEFIAAPKLRDLVLTNRDNGAPEWVTISALRRSTLRPMSLSTDFISDAYLPELLELWPNLSELHLRLWAYESIPGPITTAALVGSRHTVPLCSSLRYLTVHMEQNHPKLVEMSIQRLTRIVKKRKGYGVLGLQRVMCVWDGSGYNGINGKELEWVNVL